MAEAVGEALRVYGCCLLFAGATLGILLFLVVGWLLRHVEVFIR